MTDGFIALIDGSLPECGYADRSSFIRDAITEKLRALGIPVPKGITTPRPRVGPMAKRNLANPAINSIAAGVAKGTAGYMSTSVEAPLPASTDPALKGRVGKRRAA